MNSRLKFISYITIYTRQFIITQLNRCSEEIEFCRAHFDTLAFFVVEENKLVICRLEGRFNIFVSNENLKAIQEPRRRF